ncbi:MAG TPA: M1 family metallopeptidase [Ferruginibacter sp.]|nr:M1 family metallopeptidase [Ferruginibacter sp.]
MQYLKNYFFKKMSLQLLCLAGCGLIAAGCSAQGNTATRISSGGKLHPLQAIMDIRHYTIALDVDIAAKMINGYAEIDLVLTQPADTLLIDLINVYTVTAITVNNSKAGFSQRDHKIFIVSGSGFKAGKQKVKITYGGTPPVAVNPPWQGGFTWKKDSLGNPWVVINCQFEGGKIYFPCKDHPSDEPNEGVDLMITVPKGLVVAGPGLLQGVTNAKNNKQTWHWKTNYTISNYCVLFNIAKYKVVTRDYKTINGNTVPIHFYVLEEHAVYAQRVLDMKERDTRILEKYFGEYPWVKEKIGIADVSNYGMEHQTMISYGGENYKFQKVGGQDYSDNLFHEYAHEWWANKVTNKDWAHMWIQEGITTYAEALAFRELAGEEGYHRHIFSNRRSIRNAKPLVQGDEVNTLETYTGDIYSKGSFFMHTLRYILGDSIFFPTLKTLATDPKYTYSNFVTSADVEQLFSSRSQTDLKPLFDFYLRTTELLDITITQTAYDTYSIKIKNFFMPLPIDINTDMGTKRMIIDKAGLTIKSTVPPSVDAKGYYLKKVQIQ